MKSLHTSTCNKMNNVLQIDRFQSFNYVHLQCRIAFAFAQLFRINSPTPNFFLIFVNVTCRAVDCNHLTEQLFLRFQ